MMAKPTVFAVARFEKNMVETLKQYFDAYEDDGVVNVEVTDHGLWLVNPNGSRQFLGATEPHPIDKPQKLN